MTDDIMRQKRGVPILVQMIGMCLVTIIIVSCGISLYLYPIFERELFDHKHADIRSLVETAHSLANDYYVRSKNGEFDENEAKQRALLRLSKMRYAGTGYFWVNDMTPTMVMHPIFPDLNGKNLEKVTDSDGKYLFVNFVKVCQKDGQGLVPYKWPEPGMDKPVEKKSFVKLFSPWGWVIGTGVYTSEVQRALANLRLQLMIGTLIIISLFAAASMWLAHRIARPLHNLAGFSLGLKDDLNNRAPVEGSRESRELAIALNVTMERLSKTMVSRDRLDSAYNALAGKNQELAEALNSLSIMQTRIVQTEKMATIGQIAAGVAHEINNPMGFIKSNISSLEKYFAKISEYIAILEDKRTSPETIANEKTRLKIDRLMADIPYIMSESLDGTERIETIVKNLKSFSRIDCARMVATDINECLENTISIAWSEIKYKAELVRKYGDLPRAVCVAQQMNQVFMNLLVNAAHAIESMGTITISTWAEEESVHVSIADTGCGMPDNVRNRIFEPFFTTKSAGKGTGLGLSISYDIIKKHGGEIAVTSEPGRGSEFIVTIPLHREEASKPVEKRPEDDMLSAGFAGLT